jgi:hypothetical protein
VEDLSRLFVQIVRNLAAVDPARLRMPLPLQEIRHKIIPYRTNRRALQLESSEEYELVLIRLCAGEGGFARTEPHDLHAKFAAEAVNSNPDLTIVHRYENAVVILDERQLAQALTLALDLTFAPPEQRFAFSIPVPEEPSPAPHQPPTEAGVSEPQARPLSAAVCGACCGKLPLGRKVKFCPHCGKSQVLTHCPECQAALEPTWRHCIACGADLRRD